jgi:hypothetical protein
MNRNAGAARLRTAGALLAATVAWSCAARSRTGSLAAGDSCRPVEGRVSAATPWDSLPGSWRLTLVATGGPRSGGSVQGTLTLRAQEASLRRVDRPGPDVVTVPVTGATDVAVEQVGAQRIGNLQSADPQRPGAAIWVSQGQDGGVSAVMRIGEEMIHSSLVRFEGAYTVLYLRQVSASGIYGGWASGVTGQEASGHFCAVRAGT